MKTLITGGSGQLGWELQRCIPPGWQVTAPPSSELQLTDPAAIKAVLKRIEPQLVINCAAYTAVDQAEKETKQAEAVNNIGVKLLAEASRQADTGFIHISTDFVFDGTKSRPYLPDDLPRPVCMYGASKLEGEKRVQEIYGTQALIIRTAWVYSAHGNNFVKTMLRLMTENDQIGVVADQVGTPTWAAGLAKTIWKLADSKTYGIHHWTDSGVASWYDFAVAIYEEATNMGLLTGPVNIQPLRTEQYPTPAPRPTYSVLDKSSILEALGYFAPHWRTQLRLMLEDYE
jgi:dTDP-4-dehydrorhamnose reductase